MLILEKMLRPHHCWSHPSPSSLPYNSPWRCRRNLPAECWHLSLQWPPNIKLSFLPLFSPFALTQTASAIAHGHTAKQFYLHRKHRGIISSFTTIIRCSCWWLGKPMKLLICFTTSSSRLVIHLYQNVKGISGHWHRRVGWDCFCFTSVAHWITNTCVWFLVRHQMPVLACWGIYWNWLWEGYVIIL